MYKRNNNQIDIIDETLRSEWNTTSEIYLNKLSNLNGLDCRMKSLS